MTFILGKTTGSQSLLCFDSKPCGNSWRMSASHQLSIKLKAVTVKGTKVKPTFVLKPAKVTKTPALFQLRQQQILVCLKNLRQRFLINRLTDWLSAMFDWQVRSVYFKWPGKTQDSSCVVGYSIGPMRVCVCFSQHRTEAAPAQGCLPHVSTNQATFFGVLTPKLYPLLSFPYSLCSCTECF